MFKFLTILILLTSALAAYNDSIQLNPMVSINQDAINSYVQKKPMPKEITARQIEDAAIKGFYIFVVTVGFIGFCVMFYTSVIDR